MKRVASRNISRKPLTKKDMDNTIMSIMRMDDLGAAILSFSLLERALELCISARLPKCKSSDLKALFAGPLQGFEAKMKMARVLGILDKISSDQFDTLRQIRNIFAHSSHRYSFKRRTLRGHIKDVLLPSGVRSRLIRYGKPSSVFSNPRSRYIQATICSAFFLEEIASRGFRYKRGKLKTRWQITN